MVQTILEQKAITHHKRNFILWNTPQSKNPDKLFNYKQSLQQNIPINYSTMPIEVRRQQTPSRSYLVSETDIVSVTNRAAEIRVHNATVFLSNKSWRACAGSKFTTISDHLITRVVCCGLACCVVMWYSSPELGRVWELYVM